MNTEGDNMTTRKIELIRGVKRARVKEVLGWVGFVGVTLLMIALAMVV